MSGKDTRNPCTGLCRFDAAGACRGCHRTKAEAKGWKRLPDTAKAAINQRIRQRIRQRIQALIRAEAAGAKPPAKRLRKLDKKIGKLAAKLDALKAERAALTDAPSLHEGPWTGNGRTA